MAPSWRLPGRCVLRCGFNGPVVEGAADRSLKNNLIEGRHAPMIAVPDIDQSHIIKTYDRLLVFSQDGK